MVRQVLRVLIFSPVIFILPLVTISGYLNPFLLFLCVMGLFVSLFISASALITLIDIKPSKPRATSQTEQADSSGLPWVPKNLAQLLSAMGEDGVEFEYFSAALVIALGGGHTFHSRVGGAGDDGVDTKLINQHGFLVIVQSKRYSPGKNVGAELIRDFMGAISLKDAVYGYFVTTSELTKQAKQTAAASRRPIRVIDGKQIESLLQHRHREIALAWRDVLIARAAAEG